MDVLAAFDKEVERLGLSLQSHKLASARHCEQTLKPHQSATGSKTVICENTALVVGNLAGAA